MKPYVTLKSHGTQHIPYNIKISTKNNMIDQKRELIEVKPGYHLTIRVIPKVVDASKAFETFEYQTRNCKLVHETNGLNYLKQYSKVGCEVECAMNESVRICKCLPWFYSNNLTKIPMCDMFGANCFDKMMTNDSNYQICNGICYDDCRSTSYAVIPSYQQINDKETCKQLLIRELLHKEFKNLGMMELVITNKWIHIEDEDKFFIALCNDYLKNYISIVSIGRSNFGSNFHR